MATERDYQSLYDRIAALREQVTSRLAADLITNPQLADALTKQIDDLLQSAVDADAKHAAAARQGPGRARRRRPDAAERFRPDPHSAGRRTPTTRPSPRSGSSPSATCTTSTSTRRSASSAWCRSCRSCSAPARCGCPAAQGAFALYQFDRREVLRYTQRDRLAAYRRALRLRRRPGADRLAAQHRFPQAVHALRPPGDAVLARQADLGRDPRARLRSELRLDRHRPPRRARPAQQPEVVVVRPSQRAARRGDAAARGGVQDPRCSTTSSGCSAPTTPGTWSKKC